MARRLSLVAALALAAAPAGAQLRAKQRELLRVSTELKRTLKDLEALRAQEQALGADVSGLQTRDEASRRRLESIQGDIRRAELKRGELKSRLDSERSVSGFWSAALSDEAARYARFDVARDDLFGTQELWADQLRREAIIEKARHLRGLRGFRQTTEQAEAETRRRAQQLSASRQRAQEEREIRRREYKQKKAALEDTQIKVAAAARKAKELEETAKALTSLLDRLGKAARYRSSGVAARLDRPEHSLPWPVAGKISRPFGRERDPVLGNWTVRQGVVLSAEADAPVLSVAAGKVIFAGPFRSYGQVVIVDHDGGFFSVYGELGAVDKEKGDAVRAGERLARAGSAKEDGSGRVYLEIRRGAEALDPAVWLEKK